MASLTVLTFFVLLLQGIVVNSDTPISRLNFFDIDLLRYCAEERRGNVMVSPASIKATLAMLLEGAQGVTEAEIKNALRLANTKAEYREQLNLYLEGLKANSNGVILQNYNSVFMNNKYKMRKEYESMLRNVYLSEVFPMNFTDPNAAAVLINKWVSEKTKGLIPAIVDPVSVNPSTEILITNAMYFKGSWKLPFDPQQTGSACFHDHGTCKKVQMMEMRSLLKYSYIDELMAHAVELPYQDTRYSMVLLVPLDRNGCAPLIRDLPYMSLHRIVELLEPSDVALSLPRFTIDYAEDMVGPLKSMRINTLFSTKANLTGIFEGDSPLVNSMQHKVHMAVDEQGTVAAAATSAMVVPLIENGVTVRVDRPFVFFIRDNGLGIVLFEGRIEDPTPFTVKEQSPVPAGPPAVPAGPPAVPTVPVAPAVPAAPSPQTPLAPPAPIAPPVKGIKEQSAAKKARLQ